MCFASKKRNKILSTLHFLLELPELKDPESYKRSEVIVVVYKTKSGHKWNLMAIFMQTLLETMRERYYF